MKTSFLLLLICLLTRPVGAVDGLSYTGRLVNTNGSPVTGPVNLTFDLSYTNAPGTVLCTKALTAVALTNGVFHVKLDYASADCSGTALQAILAATPVNESVAIRVTDTTNVKVYSWQAMHALPYAVMSDVAKTLIQMGAANGEVLTWNGTAWAPAAGGGGGSGSVTSVATGTGLSGGPITTTGTISIANLGVDNAQLAAGAVSDAKVSATAAIARTKLASGTASHVIVNDGAGVMSSVAQLPIAQGGTGASTAAGARTALSLGDSAVANIGTGAGDVMSATAVPNCLATEKLQMSAGPVYAWTCALDNDSADATKLPLAGGTMTGAIDMGGLGIINLVDPTANQHAATKKYVDDQVAGAGAWTISGGDVYRASGNVGIGTTTPASALTVASSPTGTAGTIQSFNITTSYYPGSASTASAFGGYMGVVGGWNVTSATLIGSQSEVTHVGATTLGAAQAAVNDVQNTSTGTVSSAYGTDSSVKNTSTGTIDNAYALHTLMANTGGGTITTGYGLYIDTLAGTTKYGLYQSDSSGKNYFAGNVGIGTTSPAGILDIASTTSGIVLPRMTTAQRDAIAAPLGGMQIYNSATNQLNYHNGTSWQALGTAGAGISSLTAGTGLTGGTITTSGTIAVDVGTGASQIVQLDGSSKLPAVDGSALTNLNPANLSAAVGVAKGGTGLTALGAANTVLGVNNAGTAAEYKTIAAGTGISVTHTAGTVTVAATSSAPSGSAGGDLSGTYPNPGVAKLNGAAVDASPASGEILVFDGTSYNAVPLSADATMSATGAVTLATVPVSKGGTGATALTGNRIIGTNALGTALQPLTCSVGEVLTFDVSGDYTCSSIASAGNAFVQNGNSFSAGAVLGTNDNNTLAFETNNTTRMTVDTAGNVGIGTTGPSTLLHVSGDNVVGYGQMAISAAAGQQYTQQTFYNDTTEVAQIYYDNTAKIFTLGSIAATSQLVLRSGAGSERMRIDANGNVGIGTTNPTSLLSVKGGTGYVQLAGTNYGDTFLTYSGGGDVQTAIGSDASGFSYIGSKSNHPFVLKANDTEYLRVGATGNVGIGTTSPRSKLDVVGGLDLRYATSTLANGNSGIRWQNGTDVTSAFGFVVQSGLWFQSDTVVGNSDFGVRGATADGSLGSVNFVVRANGNVGIGTSTPAGILDIASTTSGIVLPRMTTVQRDAIAAPLGGMQVYNSTTNQLNYHNGTSWQVLGTAGAGISSLTAGTGLTGGTITTSGTIAVDVGTGASQIVQLDGSSKLPAVDGSALTNLNPANLSAAVPLTKGGTGLTAAGTANQFLGMNAGATAAEYKTMSATSPLTLTHGVGTATLAMGTVPVSSGGTGATALTGDRIVGTNTLGTALQPLSCSTNEVLTFDVTGAYLCASVASLMTTGFVNGGNSFAATGTLGTNDNNNLAFETNNTTRMTIDTSGNVGIGTTSPSAALQIRKDQNALSYVDLYNTNTGASAGSILRLISENVANTGAVTADLVKYHSGAFVINNNETDTGAFTAFGVGGSERMRINSSGNVGIGTTAPGSKLHVSSIGNGDQALFEGTASHSMVMIKSADNTKFPLVRFTTGAGTPNDSEIGVDPSGGFYVNQTVAVGATGASIYAAAGGNVGIGTNAPTAVLHLKAGTAAANTAPLMFTAGTNLTTPENGAMEFDGTNLYITTGGTRKTLSTSGGSSNYVSSGTISTTNATASTSTITGSIVTAGGVGIGGDLNVGVSTTSPVVYGSSSPSGTLTLDSTSSGTKGTVLIAPSGGNVGIGVTSPQSKLDIYGPAGSGTIRLQNFLTDSTVKSGSMVTSHYTNAEEPLAMLYGISNATTSQLMLGGGNGSLNATTMIQFFTAANNTTTSGTERMRIDSTGNVGIGTTNPNNSLEIRRAGEDASINIGANYDGAIYNNAAITFGAPRGDTVANSGAANRRGYVVVPANSGANDSSLLLGANTASGVVTGNAAAIRANQSAVEINSSGVVDFWKASTNYARINGSGASYFNGGNVGIGTATPAYTLDVNGTVHATAFSGPISSSTLTGTTTIGAGGANLAADASNGYIRGVAGIALQDAGATTTYSYLNTAGGNSYLNASGGNVGIGTTTPGQKLTVNGNILVKTGGSLMLETSGGGVRGMMRAVETADDNGAAGGSGLVIATSGGENIAFKNGGTAGTEYMVIKGTGNVGIGTSGPSSLLHVNSSTANAAETIQSTFGSVILNMQPASGNKYSYINLGDGTSYGWQLGKDIDAGSLAGANGFYIYEMTSGSNSTRFAINKGGNVGIGTTNPGARLDVSMSGVALGTNAGDTTTIERLYQSNGNASYLDLKHRRHIAGSGWVGTNFRIQRKIDATDQGFIDFGIDGISGDGGLGFGSGSTTRMVVKDTGNVGIGTTAPFARTEIRSDVAGGAPANSGATDSNTISRIRNNAVALDVGNMANGNFWVQNRNVSDFSVNYPLLLNPNGGNVGIGTTNPTYQLQLSTDSAAKPGTSTWTIASDARLKDIRAPFDRGLEAIEGIHPIYFNYQRDNPLDLPSDKEYVGIIAQDAQKAVPEAVSTDEQGYLHVTNDAIIWTVLNSVKELYHKWTDDSRAIHRDIASVKIENDQLKKENEQIKRENAEIKARLERIEKALQSK